MRYLGTTDEVSVCDHCGKRELQRVVAFEDDAGNTVYFGTTCAKRAYGRNVFNKARSALDREMDKIQRVRDAANLEYSAALQDAAKSAGFVDWQGRGDISEARLAGVDLSSNPTVVARKAEMDEVAQTLWDMLARYREIPR